MSAQFVLYRPLIESGTLLLRADREKVLLLLPEGEETLLWEDIDKVYLSQRLPRQVYLVFLTHSGERKAVLIARLSKHIKSIPYACTYALLEDDAATSRRETTPVLLHLKDGQMIASLLSVRSS